MGVNVMSDSDVKGSGNLDQSLIETGSDGQQIKDNMNVEQAKEIVGNDRDSVKDKMRVEGGGRAAGLALGLDKFTFEKKQAFLTLLNKWWPNISQTCREIGIHPGTYYNHLIKDKSFAQAVAEIKQARIDRIEAVAVESAENPTKGFLDRAMILRAHRPELYDRAKVVKIEGYKMDGAEKARRLGAVDAAIDAEIVKTYTTRQERRRLPAGGGEGTGQAGQGEAGKADGPKTD